MRSRGEITLKNAKIPAVVEKIHQKSVWCTEILNGIGKQKIELLCQVKTRKIVGLVSKINRRKRLFKQSTKKLLHF